MVSDGSSAQDRAHRRDCRTGGLAHIGLTTMTPRAVMSLGLALMLVVAVSPARAQTDTASAAPLTGGFVDHVQPADIGVIDWTNGYILADGIAYAEGTDKQQELLADRAACVVAARNALAIAKGIRINDSMVIGDQKDALVRVEGRIKGHKVIESHWRPDADPPTCRVVLRVPLWGVKSVASVFVRNEQQRVRRSRERRCGLRVDRVDISDFVLVLDARGLDLAPCLFPVVTDIDGRRLYDLTTRSGTALQLEAPVRYVQSDLPYEQLQARVESGVPWGVVFAAYRPGIGDVGQRNAGAPSAGPAPPTTTQPTTQPGRASRRRAKRRMAVQVAQVDGAQRAQLVLTREDAERLRRSPEAAEALRTAQVLVVVDAPAAGTEGRMPALPGRALAAISPDAWPAQPTLLSPICSINRRWP